MKNSIIKISTVALTLTILLSACSNKTTESAKEESSNQAQNIVELSGDQIKLIDLKLGTAEMKDLSGVIKANGMLDVPPQNHVSISAPLGGFVKNTELLQGMFIKKGQTLAVMQHPDYIQMQQDYLETKSQLEFLEAEYKRQTELAKDNVNSQKTLQQSRSQYESMLAKNMGLRSKLWMINIDADKLTGRSIQNTITLNSPISGYVAHVNVNIGKYVAPTDIMFKIVDTEHLHAELTVFEKDVQKIKVGQKVRFTLANETTERMATVYLIGREIDADRTVRIHCHLDTEDRDLLPGMYLKAYVETGINKVTALPDEAFVSFEGKDHVFIKLNNSEKFKLVEVKKGVSEMGYTEVIWNDELDTNALFVLNGAYDLLSKMKNSEEE